ncbi:hypothetical protein COE51_01225 [Bacillus pseudomycoides]|nr:hypothetical protein COE51_01225 [Bacillus pseudomycoides]
MNKRITQAIEYLSNVSEKYKLEIEEKEIQLNDPALSEDAVNKLQIKITRLKLEKFRIENALRELV